MQVKEGYTGWRYYHVTDTWEVWNHSRLVACGNGQDALDACCRLLEVRT